MCCSPWGQKLSDRTQQLNRNNMCIKSSGLPSWHSGKESACRRLRKHWLNLWGRFPGGENGNSVQYFCLENPIDRGAWWTTVHSVKRVRHDSAHMHCQVIRLYILNINYYCQLYLNKPGEEIAFKESVNVLKNFNMAKY